MPGQIDTGRAQRPTVCSGVGCPARAKRWCMVFGTPLLFVQHGCEPKFAEDAIFSDLRLLPGVCREVPSGGHLDVRAPLREIKLRLIRGQPQTTGSRRAYRPAPSRVQARTRPGPKRLLVSQGRQVDGHGAHAVCRLWNPVECDGAESTEVIHPSAPFQDLGDVAEAKRHRDCSRVSPGPRIAQQEVCWHVRGEPRRTHGATRKSGGRHHRSNFAHGRSQRLGEEP